MKSKVLCFVVVYLLSGSICFSQTYPDFSKKSLKGKFVAMTSDTKSTLFLFEDNTFVHYGCSLSDKGKTRQLWYTTGKWLANKELVMCRTFPDTLNQDLLLSELKKRYPSEKRNRSSKEQPLQRLNYVNYIFLIDGKNLRDKTQNLSYVTGH